MFTLTIAFFSSSPQYWALFGALSGLLGHVSSAYTMLTMLFGQKTFMIPIYTMFISLHAVTATRLIMDPGSFYRLTYEYIVLHAYAWVRVSYAIMRVLKSFESYEYSVAILIASFISLPAVLGTASNLFLLGIPVIFSFFVEPLLKTYGLVTWNDSHMEAMRDRISADRRKELAAARAVALKTGFGTQKGESADTDEARALAVFKYYDKDSNGDLEISELGPLIADLGLDQTDVLANLDAWDIDHSGTISFAEFYRHIWHYNSKDELAIKRGEAAISKGTAILTKAERAKIIFDAIDADGSGMLELQELKSLLTVWGVPPRDAELSLQQHDVDGDGKIDLQEFTTTYGDVYEYGINVLLNGRVK